MHNSNLVTSMKEIEKLQNELNEIFCKPNSIIRYEKLKFAIDICFLKQFQESQDKNKTQCPELDKHFENFSGYLSPFSFIIR